MSRAQLLKGLLGGQRAAQVCDSWEISLPRGEKLDKGVLAAVDDDLAQAVTLSVSISAAVRPRAVGTARKTWQRSGPPHGLCNGVLRFPCMRVSGCRRAGWSVTQDQVIGDQAGADRRPGESMTAEASGKTCS